MENRIINLDSGRQSYELSIGGTIWLDPTDMGVLARFNECMSDFDTMKASHADLQAAFSRMNASGNIDDDEGAKALGEAIKDAGKALRELDDDMCKRVDYLFDSEVAKACAGGGTMFDLVHGQYRFESIIAALMKVYEDSIQSEAAAMRSRVDKAKGSKYHNVHPANRH